MKAVWLKNLSDDLPMIVKGRYCHNGFQPNHFGAKLFELIWGIQVV
jgi:hypothetical protein